jgi:hypothetical protein
MAELLLERGSFEPVLADRRFVFRSPPWSSQWIEQHPFYRFGKPPWGENVFCGVRMRFSTRSIYMITLMKNTQTPKKNGRLAGNDDRPFYFLLP